LPSSAAREKKADSLYHQKGKRSRLPPERGWKERERACRADLEREKRTISRRKLKAKEETRAKAIATFRETDKKKKESAISEKGSLP